MKFVLFVFLISIAVIFAHCYQGHDGVVVPLEPYESLSDYNLFKGTIADLKPADRVLPYDLNSPLFTDYALKSRYVWMPEGSSANYTTDHVLDFPVGTMLIKNFFYSHDQRDNSKGRRIIETRILINRGDKWDAYGYIWNDAQTEATYTLVGDIKDVSWTNNDGEKQHINYIIPNKNQCKGCHGYKNVLLPIGPRVRNLNKDFDYADGTSNQLDKWARIGYLSGLKNVSQSPSVAVWNQPEKYGLHERAMAYLDINCGHCHNPDGAANTSGLTLLADSKMDMTLGIYKATVSAGAGTGGHTYSIIPGNPGESIMVYRMQSTDPGAMMPELGRSLVHEEGVALIADWILAMKDEPSKL